MAKKTLDKWQFGDFQTPADLATAVVQTLKSNHDINPDVVIEPTCGKGAFVQAALDGFTNAKVIGFDVNPGYAAEALTLIPEKKRARLFIAQGDFFLLDWEEILESQTGHLLILGNPPWVTSSELGSLNSKNLPEKTNFQGRRGIEAITGSGNFDISEWMLLRHVDWLSERDGALAMLCKYAVARKVMRQIRQSKDHRLFGHIYSIDAKKHFSASVDACLFVLTTEKGNADCEVYPSLDSTTPDYIIGERDGYLVRDVKLYEKRRDLRGQDIAYLWRSGLKHDCSKVMELAPVGENYVNGLGESIAIEKDYVYPLLKSSDVGNSRVDSCRRVVVVTQTSVGEDTKTIEATAPKTWAYLESHADLLDARKSSIYRSKPPYSIFGVGMYTFKPWKVAISGLYKSLNFCLVGPIDEKPVVFDDTVNFLSFDSESEACFVYKLLQSEPALEFYTASIFWDEKRPITTEILRRLSLKAVARELGVEREYMKLVKESAAKGTGQLQLGVAERRADYKAASNT